MSNMAGDNNNNKNLHIKRAAELLSGLAKEMRVKSGVKLRDAAEEAKYFLQERENLSSINLEFQKRIAVFKQWNKGRKKGKY